MTLLDSWVKAGLPALEILRAMTVHPARLLGLDDQRGRIEPGMAADIIAVDKNPLDDIQTLESVVFVMKDGRVVKDVQ